MLNGFIAFEPIESLAGFTSLNVVTQCISLPNTPEFRIDCCLRVKFPFDKLFFVLQWTIMMKEFQRVKAFVSQWKAQLRLYTCQKKPFFLGFPRF
jgi:hypothetical protein